MITVRQLAKLAGVSRGTVSRALNNAPDVNPETRARILELATYFQYRSNRSAAASNVMTIGCLVPRISSFFFSKILAGLIPAAFREMIHIIVLETRSTFDITRLAVSTLIDQRVKGIVIASGHAKPILKEDILRMYGAGIFPILIQNTRSEIPVDTIQTDWDIQADLVVNHFIAQGHQYILPFTDSPLAESNAIQQRLKLLGFPNLLFDDSWLPLPVEQRLRHILEIRPRVTAIYVGSIVATIQLVSEARRQGLQVPGDLSFISSSNAAELLDFTTPTISAIEQYPEEIGKRAFELLHRRIAEDCSRPTTPEVVRIPPKLIARASSGPVGFKSK